MKAEGQLDEVDMRIIKELSEGLTTKEIAVHLHVSHHTVKGRIEKMRTRHDCKNSLHLVVKMFVLHGLW